MNIHITDKNLVSNLNSSKLLSIEVGSSMYGTNDSLSDKDYLTIYLTSKSELYSSSFSHHQIQYKDLDNNIDYNFVSIHSFIRNLLSGDSTINFEIINTNKLIGTKLEFLYNNRFEFFTYNIIRSYLGLARRDLKEMSSLSNSRDIAKKLAHAYRGYEFAKMIYDGDFSIENITDEIRNKIFELKNIDKSLNHIEFKNIRTNIEELRSELNFKLDKGEIIRYLNSSFQRKLDEWMISLFEGRELISFDLGMFYESNENGIIY